MKDRSGILLILAGAVLVIGAMCRRVPAPAVDGQADEGNLAGCLQIAGSSSMEKYASALAEGFMERHPGVAVTLQFTGSSAGIAAVAEGRADIGMSSRYLQEGEKEAGAVENVVGYDGIAICGNPANGISGFTRQQLSRLYAGEAAGWLGLGGSDLPVVLIGREAGSGTRSAFEEFLGMEDQCTYANEMDSMGAVMARIEATPGAVGYVSLEAAVRALGKAAGGGPGNRAETPVTVFSVDGVEPSLENIRNGSYPLYRPFVMVTKGEASGGSRLVRAWFAYVESGEGRAIAERMQVVAAP